MRDIVLIENNHSVYGRKSPLLIVMLTYDDQTVSNAFDIFDQHKDSDAEYWGFKEKPLSLSEMKKIYAYMKSCGKKTVLEVVAYTEKKCLDGAIMAAECGCDLLMGTIYSDVVNDFCKKNGMKYMPFVGEVYGRPSVLKGSCENIIKEAKEYLDKGVYGFDLLGYRYTEDPVKLNREFISAVNAPVCIAGSINSYKRLDEIRKIRPWAFTVGSAFFDKTFGEDFGEQINTVCHYMRE